MKTAVLINDTRFEMHHGCTLAVSNMTALLNSHGIKIAHSAPVSEDWSKSEKTISEIEKCDVIIVNGEGSIHSGKPQAKNLLEASTLAKKLNKKIYLVNTIYHNNPKNFDRLIENFDGILARDNISYQTLKAINPATFSGCDLSLYSEKKFTIIEPSKPREGYGFTCSVSTKKTIEIYKTINNSVPSPEYLPIIFDKNIWNDHPSNTKEKLAKILNYLSTQGVSKALSRIVYFQKNKNTLIATRKLSPFKSVEAYSDKISTLELLLSARFHATCIAIKTSTPFMAFPSNTAKIENLISDIGLNPERIIRTNEDLAKIHLLKEYSQAELESIKEYINTKSNTIRLFFEKLQG